MLLLILWYFIKTNCIYEDVLNSFLHESEKIMAALQFPAAEDMHEQSAKRIKTRLRFNISVFYQATLKSEI